MAVAWASLAVLTAISVTFFVSLDTKADTLSAKVDAQGKDLSAGSTRSGRRSTLKGATFAPPSIRSAPGSMPGSTPSRSVWTLTSPATATPDR